MDKKCPYCGAETRPGDNFCLNCGNRLPTEAPAATQMGGEATQASSADWSASGGSLGGGWSDSANPTVVDPSSEPTYRAEPSAPTVQATLDKVEQPGRFILRAENGDVVQEYLLDKLETTVGRAPNSDILLSKDKLTSRRHAVIRFEEGHYVLRDERSANGTFVNGQQIEEMAPIVLQNGDHIGIGEHELIFRAYGASSDNVEDLPTVAVPLDSGPATYRTQNDELATVASNEDEFRTVDAVEPEIPAKAEVFESNGVVLPNVPGVPMPSFPIESIPTPTPSPVVQSKPASDPLPASGGDEEVNLSRLTSISQPELPDMTDLMAALSTLDGQFVSLQERFKATQEAMHDHESRIAQTTSQLKTSLRRVSDRMDNTIAEVARSREALAWAELLQLVEDVMNNPRDIEYVTKLARKSRDLNKMFQIHQNVLNAMAECNSLLRSMIGDDK